MPYRLISGESVHDGMRRIVSEQIERSLGELADTDLDRADAIHQVRMRCKKIRAALRLVRGGLNTYSIENAWYRDAARLVSDLRNTEAMVETCDALARRFVDQVDPGVIRPIRGRLETRKNMLMEDPDRIDARLQELASAMAEGHKRVASLRIEGKGYDTALAGMCRTYTRARTAMDAACGNPTPETFHEWRKWVKYHGYHMHLLRDAWPSVVRARQNEADKLGELLGDHHNLGVLRAWVLADRGLSASDEVVSNFIRLVDKRAAQIEKESRPLGRRLCAEKPKHLERRFAVYLRVWSEEH